jgi:transposase-like protein
MIVSNGTYRMKEGIGRRFRCRSCGQSFCHRTGTLYDGLHVPEERIISALKLLSKGLSIRKTSQILGLKTDTLRRWLNRFATQSEKINEALITEHGISTEELATLWDYVRRGTLRERGIVWRRRCGWRQGWDME